METNENNQDWHTLFNAKLKEIVVEFYYWFQTVSSDRVNENFDYWSEGPAHGWKKICELIELAQPKNGEGWKAIAETNREAHEQACKTIYELQDREKEIWVAFGKFCSAIEKTRR